MIMREIKFRMLLQLDKSSHGSYRRGDIDVFYFDLLSSKNGLIRYPIDDFWDVLHCDEYIGLKDKNGGYIYEGDTIKFQVANSVEPDVFTDTVTYCNVSSMFKVGLFGFKQLYTGNLEIINQGLTLKTK